MDALNFEQWKPHAIPDKVYYNHPLSVENNAFYFLLIDRFADNHLRTVHTTGYGYGNPEQLKQRIGGTIRGIINHIDYIAELGITALWLSPWYHNNDHAYHGYAVQDYLAVDPRMGTADDLKELIDACHARGIAVMMDAVLNHTGGNWTYAVGEDPDYDHGKVYDFGAWIEGREPIPTALIDEDCYLRKGRTVNWNTYPETQEGDFFELKKLDHKYYKVVDTMIRVHKWWLAEFDIDGIRVDAAKHMDKAFLKSFCTKMKTFARSLGKDNFWLVGEAFEEDDKLDGYASLGFDAMFDFSTHFLLTAIPLGQRHPGQLQQLLSQRNERGSTLPRVNFSDNHDQVCQPYIKKRILAQLGRRRAHAALWMTYLLPGAAVLYYGTEQGFVGQGDTDAAIREAMFHPDDKATDAFDTSSDAYRFCQWVIKTTQALKMQKGLMEITSLPLERPRNNLKKVLAMVRILNTGSLYLLYNRNPRAVTTEIPTRGSIVWANADILIRHNRLRIPAYASVLYVA